MSGAASKKVEEHSPAADDHKAWQSLAMRAALQVKLQLQKTLFEQFGSLQK